jgi:hypothetical protein
MMSHLCNRCVREFLILARTWFTFGLPSKSGVTHGHRWRLRFHGKLSSAQRDPTPSGQCGSIGSDALPSNGLEVNPLFNTMRRCHEARALAYFTPQSDPSWNLLRSLSSQGE